MNKATATKLAKDVTLTAKETALMTAIAERHFSFFDQGLVEESGIWTDSMTAEVAGSKHYEVSSTQRGVATVIASLGRKGLLETLPANGEDGAWTQLTKVGEVWCEKHAPKDEVKAEAAKPAPAAKPAKVEAPAATDLPAIGEAIKYKDGKDYTFVSLSKDGLCYRVKDTDGKASYKRISSFV